jgi:hypothetical protein
MPSVKTVAERMSDHVVPHYPTVPGIGKSAQALDATWKTCANSIWMLWNEIRR